MKKSAEWTAEIITISVLVVLALLVALGIWRYGWGWTGFLIYATPKSDTVEFHPGKTLWDWMGLLIIPAVLALGAFFLSRAQRRNERKIAETQRTEDRQIAKEERETERQIARDREEERTLQNYFEVMTKLLLEEDLRTSSTGSEVRSIARSRTLTVLRSLNTERKGSILRFLYEAGLIDAKGPVVLMSGADLTGVNLNNLDLIGIALSAVTLNEANLSLANLDKAILISANLVSTNLHETNLNYAKLSFADLSFADLSGAELNGANLTFANLSNANLLAATLSEADLTFATLSEADLTFAKLSEAKYNDGKKWPADFDPERAGAKFVELTLSDLTGIEETNQ